MPTTDTQQQFLTRRQAATYLGVSPKWLAQTGKHLVPHYKFGGSCQYKIDELSNWARQQRVSL